MAATSTQDKLDEDCDLDVDIESVDVDENAVHRRNDENGLPCQDSTETPPIEARCDEMSPSPSKSNNARNTSWSDDEICILQQGIESFGNRWTKIARMLKTKTVLQIRTFARKHMKDQNEAKLLFQKKPEVIPGAKVRLTMDECHDDIDVVGDDLLDFTPSNADRINEDKKEVEEPVGLFNPLDIDLKNLVTKDKHNKNESRLDALELGDKWSCHAAVSSSDQSGMDISGMSSACCRDDKHDHCLLDDDSKIESSHELTGFSGESTREQWPPLEKSCRDGMTFTQKSYFSCRQDDSISLQSTTNNVNTDLMKTKLPRDSSDRPCQQSIEKEAVCDNFGKPLSLLPMDKKSSRNTDTILSSGVISVRDVDLDGHKSSDEFSSDKKGCNTLVCQEIISPNNSNKRTELLSSHLAFDATSRSRPKLELESTASSKASDTLVDNCRSPEVGFQAVEEATEREEKIAGIQLLLTATDPVLSASKSIVKNMHEDEDIITELNSKSSDSCKSYKMSSTDVLCHDLELDQYEELASYQAQDTPKYKAILPVQGCHGDSFDPVRERKECLAEENDLSRRSKRRRKAPVLFQVPEVTTRTKTKTLEGFTVAHVAPTSGDKILKEKTSESVSMASYHRLDPFKLIPCFRFPSSASTPFRVEICLDSLIVMDFHAHLTTSEVIGLIGGKYNYDKRVLTLSRLAPCPNVGSDIQCEMDPVSQADACKHLNAMGLDVVAWYHSHPLFAPTPSIRDLQTQMQLQDWFSSDGMPFIGVIISPFDSKPLRLGQKRSQLTCVTTTDQEDSSRSYRLPFSLDYTVADRCLSDKELAWIAEEFKHCMEIVTTAKRFLQERQMEQYPASHLLIESLRGWMKDTDNRDQVLNIVSQIVS